MVQSCSRRESGRIDSESLLLNFLVTLRTPNEILRSVEVAEGRVIRSFDGWRSDCVERGRVEEGTINHFC